MLTRLLQGFSCAGPWDDEIDAIQPMRNPFDCISSTLLPSAGTCCAAALLACPGAAAGQDQPDHLYAEGSHYQVLCWFYSERVGNSLAESLRDLAEGVREQADALLLEPDQAPPEGGEEPFQIFVYAARKGVNGYNEGVASVAAGTLPRALFFVHYPSRTAHIRMRPVPTDRMFEIMGMPPETLRLAATGAARARLLDLSGGQEAAVGWLSNGLCHWLASRALAAAGKDSADCTGIWLGTRVLRLRSLMGDAGLPGLQEVLQDRLAELQPEDVEALQALWFHFLQERFGERVEWRAATRAAVRGGSGAGFVDALGGLAGAQGLAGLDAEFRAWLLSRQPTWDETAPAMQEHPDGWLQAPVAGNAVCWSTLTPESEAYRISGEFRVFVDAKKHHGQANILLGSLDGDFLQITAHSATGLWVWDYRKEKGQFEMIKSDAWTQTMAVREWIPFELTVTPDELSVKVHSEEPAPISVRGRDMSGAWGVGTFKGCATLWRKLEIQEVRLGDD